MIRNMIIFNLEKNGYQAKGFSSAEAFLRNSESKIFDLVILDIVLPNISGEGLMRELRKIGDDTPVLMLTVKSDMATRLRALNTGADDYMVKPFNMSELIARTQALIRRSLGKRRIPSSRILIINGHRINTSNRECESNQGKTILSEKEIKLLEYLSSHPREPLSRADILEEVWGMNVAPTPRTVDNFILKFRKLFEDDPENPRHFLSVRNKGYRFER